MDARRKLNRAYFNGSLIIAGLIGIVTTSGTAFVCAAGVLLALNLMSGEIRPVRRRSRSRG